MLTFPSQGKTCNNGRKMKEMGKCKYPNIGKNYAKNIKKEIQTGKKCKKWVYNLVSTVVSNQFIEMRVGITPTTLGHNECV